MERDMIEVELSAIRADIRDLRELIKGLEERLVRVAGDLQDINETILEGTPSEK